MSGWLAEVARAEVAAPAYSSTTCKLANLKRSYRVKQKPASQPTTSLPLDSNCCLCASACQARQKAGSNVAHISLANQNDDDDAQVKEFPKEPFGFYLANKSWPNASSCARPPVYSPLHLPQIDSTCSPSSLFAFESPKWHLFGRQLSADKLPLTRPLCTEAIEFWGSDWPASSC